MGVQGLWKLIEASGKPVPLETLENKTLAIDVSIWLHQAVKGFQDSKGAPVPNAHLLGLYHRICKLLYFRIKPIFVFDGGVPVLKKQTIAKRHQSKTRTVSQADQIRRKLLDTLLKHSAISKVLSEKAKAEITSPSKRSSSSKANDEDNLYYLPPTEEPLEASSSSSEDEDGSGHHWDLHSIDTNSAQFKALPVDVRHEILSDLKETRKQSSWGRINELPTQSNDFSSYQMKRLLKRQAVQSALEDAEKEMGGHSLSLGELEKLLKDQGVLTNAPVKGNRIASDENERYILISDVKQAIEEAKRAENALKTIREEAEKESLEEGIVLTNKGEQEFTDDLQKAIALSLQEQPSTSSGNVEDVGVKKNTKKPLPVIIEDSDESASEVEEVVGVQQKLKKFSSAQSYMMEYSGLTPNEIAKIISGTAKVVCSTGDESKISSSSEVESRKEEPKKKPESEEAVVGSSEVGVMSASSGESDDDDFMEVEEPTEVEPLQVVIKPSEAEDDDLFRDVFENQAASSTQDSIKDKMVAEDQHSIARSSTDPTGVFDAETHATPQLENNHVESFVPETMEENEELTTEVSAKAPDEREIPPDTSWESVEEDVTSKTEDVPSTSLTTKIDKSLEAIRRENEEDRRGSLKGSVAKLIKEYTRTASKDASDEESTMLTVETMAEMKENLQQEEMELATATASKDRMAGNITDQMYQEAQELLELFGVPFLIAPMEAEAQCAFLDAMDLTDGTITDDSDIWLFGGQTVYKNFFNQSKHVLEYRAEAIHRNFKLSREQLILLALLVGSDYTIGLSGVGPVTALEILAAFPPKPSDPHTQLISGLAEFRTWFVKGKQQSGLGRVSLRSKLRNLAFHENFPSLAVVQAYLEPKVETSKEKFSWAKPDLIGLISFAKDKFGWTRTRTEEILRPVFKRLEEKRSQASIKDFFKITHVADSSRAEAGMSKRVKSAVNRIGKPDADEEEAPEPKKAKKGGPSRKKDTTEEGDEEEKSLPKRKKVATKRKASPEDEAEEPSKPKKRAAKKQSAEEEIIKGQQIGAGTKNAAAVALQQNADVSSSINEDLVKNAAAEKKAQTEECAGPSGAKKPTKRKNVKNTEVPEESAGSSDPPKPITKKTTPKENTTPEEASAGPSGLAKPKRRRNIFASTRAPLPEDADPELKLLEAIETASRAKVDQITQEAESELTKLTTTPPTKKPLPPKILLRKEVIPQKQRDKSESLRNKMKAIEVFRKSRQGPGYVKKKPKPKQAPKEDAGLSESSSDE